MIQCEKSALAGEAAYKRMDSKTGIVRFHGSHDTAGPQAEWRLSGTQLRDRFTIRIGSNETNQSTAYPRESYSINYDETSDYHALAFTLPNLYNDQPAYLHKITRVVVRSDHFGQLLEAVPQRANVLAAQAKALTDQVHTLEAKPGVRRERRRDADLRPNIQVRLDDARPR